MPYFDKQTMISPQDALPGRAEALGVSARHYVSGEPMQDSRGALNCPEGCRRALFGLGCFWGAERLFWSLPGVRLTAVGYAAGYTHNPHYEEVCSGRTGHNEVVAVVYCETEVDYSQLLAVFWQGHDPTQGMRQGNDRGTQYRSGIYTSSDGQQALAEVSCGRYQKALSARGFSAITTEILPAPRFYFAEHYHQQYLAKQPEGYCGLAGAGVAYPSAG